MQAMGSVLVGTLITENLHGFFEHEFGCAILDHDFRDEKVRTTLVLLILKKGAPR